MHCFIGSLVISDQHSRWCRRLVWYPVHLEGVSQELNCTCTSYIKLNVISFHTSEIGLSGYRFQSILSKADRFSGCGGIVRAFGSGMFFRLTISFETPRPRSLFLSPYMFTWPGGAGGRRLGIGQWLPKPWKVRSRLYRSRFVFCNWRLILQHLSRFTRWTCSCTAPTSTFAVFSKIASKNGLVGLSEDKKHARWRSLRASPLRRRCACRLTCPCPSGPSFSTRFRPPSVLAGPFLARQKLMSIWTVFLRHLLA